MRQFGVAGLGITGAGFASIQQMATSVIPASNNAAKAANIVTYWGADLDGNQVTNQAQFNAAVTKLSTPAGRDPFNKAGWVYPPAWTQLDINFNTTDPSSAGAELVGNPAATVKALNNIGVSTLMVYWLSCTSSAFVFTSSSMGDAVYWSERWELYKHQYMLAGWSWQRGITRAEYWNEPDLNAPCINGITWMEHVTLRSLAIQTAYADFNADVTAGRRQYPPGITAPIMPQVMGSAFSSATFGTSANAATIQPNGPFAYQTFAGQNTLFPPQANPVQTSNTWQNSQLLSWHSYGKTGHALLLATQAYVTSLAAFNNPSANVPVVTTEHQAHTNGQWNGYSSTVESPFEASRLGNQLISMASGGFDSYVFKFSVRMRYVSRLEFVLISAIRSAFRQGTPSGNGGITKSGLHWGDNSVSPYPIGDASLSGETMAQMAPYLTGGKPLLTCAPPTSYTNFGGYLFCVTVQDNSTGTNRYHMILNNDYNGLGSSGGSASDPTSPAPSGQAFALTVDFAGIAGVSASSYAIINEVSSPSYFGEISDFISFQTRGSRQVTHTVPAFATIRITVPQNAQQQVVLTSTGSATLAAGANAAKNYGGSSYLTVATSTAASHESTSVAIVEFDLTGNTAASMASQMAILELTVASATANHEASVLSVVGINPCAGAWSESTITWSGAKWVLNTPTGVIGAIVNNFVKLGPQPGAGPGNAFVGHITVNAADAGVAKRVDVTPYVRSAAAGGMTKVAFLVARRFRTNGVCVGSSGCPNACVAGVCTSGPGNAAGPLPADDLDAGASVSFFSDDATAAQGQPTLRILADATITGDITPPTTNMCGSAPGAAAPPTPGSPSAPVARAPTPPAPPGFPQHPPAKSPPPQPPLPAGWPGPTPPSPPPKSPPPSPPPSPPRPPGPPLGIASSPLGVASALYVTSHLQLTGYTVATFDATAQLAFVTGVASLLSISPHLVSITSISAPATVASGRRRSLLQAAPSVAVQFQVAVTPANSAALSGALHDSLLNDSLEKGLQSAGLTALQGPIGVLEASTTGSTQNAPIFKLPAPPVQELQLRHQDVLGIGIGVGLGVPFAAACIFGAYKFANCAPAKAVDSKQAEEAPAGAEEAAAV